MLTVRQAAHASQSVVGPTGDLLRQRQKVTEYPNGANYVDPNHPLNIATLMSIMKQRRKAALTEAQKQMYASEKLINFRWIAKVTATYSNYTLTDKDLADDNLFLELAEIGTILSCSLADFDAN